MATKNLIANGLWIIRITEIILAKSFKRNCVGEESKERVGVIKSIFFILSGLSVSKSERL